MWFDKIPSFNNEMLRAASTTTFFSFCKPGDLVKPQWKARLKITQQFIFHMLMYVAVDNAANNSTISILIEASRANQSQKGYMTFLGSTGDDLCPVAALKSYMALKNRPGPLFQWNDQRPLRVVSPYKSHKT